MRRFAVSGLALSDEDKALIQGATSGVYLVSNDDNR